jgi:hypothetical protein
MSVYIPDLDKKFRHLFSRHATINTYKALAAQMNVAPSLISGWKNGTDYSRPDHVPIRHIGTVCDLLQVEQEILELPDLAQFVSRIRDRSESPIWDRMVSMSPDNGCLRILRKTRVLAEPTLLANQRGLYVPSNPADGVPVFYPAEDVLVRLDAEPGRYAILLLLDHNGWECLHPTSSDPQTPIDGVLLFPPQPPLGEPIFARFNTVIGNQKLAAVLLREPPPPALLENLLGEGDLPRTLLQLAALLQRPDAGVVVQHRFQVAG